MLVAPGELPNSLANDASAAASHNATLDVFSPNAATAHRSADMETATADGQNAPSEPMATALPNFTGGFVPNEQAVMDATDLNGQSQPVMMGNGLDAPISFDQPNMHDMGMVPDFTSTGSYAAPSKDRLTAFARLRFEDGSYYMHTYQIILGRNVELAQKDARRIARAEQLRKQGEGRRAEALLHGRKRKRGQRGARSVISEAGGIVNAPVNMMPMEYQQRRQSIASHSLSGSSSHHQDGSQETPVEHAPQDMLMQAFPVAHDQLENQVAPEDPNDCPIVPIHPQHIMAKTGRQGPKGISREHAKIFYDFDNGNFCLEVLGSNGLHHNKDFLKVGRVVPLEHGDEIQISAVQILFYLPDVALTDEQRNRPGSGSNSRPMSFCFENGQGELESDEQIDDSGSEDLSINPRHVFYHPVGSDFDSEDDAMGEEEEGFDEELVSPEPRPKQKLSLKLTNKTSKKELKANHKRKAIREPSPEEPPAKKAKSKAKEASKELPKEKGKAPLKAPAKTPAKEPDSKSAKNYDKPDLPVKSESPTALRKPIDTEGEDIDMEGVITAEVARQHNLPASLIGQPLEKRKGPGRPPKDGVMSKRQRSQLIKQAKEIEKAKAQGIDISDLPTPTVKPKIARARKDSTSNALDGDDDDVRETTEKGDGVTNASEKKQTKTNKPPRTPSPEMRIEDYTEEQLQRPSANYVVLIHEAISSSSTGQMNLQQIYNYIERKYPWYKFKTTTSGWQSSVRHNLGQHDAFMKGDKEGKGYNWRINPNVSIEKERRKRQVSPPQVSHAQRQGYFPPPNGYPPYGQPPYYPGMPAQGVPPNAAPRPPPSMEPVQPRLPPSLARTASTSTPAPQAAPNPSPYTSPWAGGGVAGSPPAPPPASSAATSSGQYGVLYPTSAPQGSQNNYAAAGAYGNQGASAGPYASAPRPYTPYSPAGGHSAAPQPPNPPAPAPNQSQSQIPQNDAAIPHPSGRYPLSTNPELIRQLEAFRGVYLQARVEPGEETKVDNAIRAFLGSDSDFAAKLTPAERGLLSAIQSIPGLQKLRDGGQAIKHESGDATGTVTQTVAIATDAAANTVPNSTSTSSQPQQSTATESGPAPPDPSMSEPHKFTPNMAAAPSSVPVTTTTPIQTQRPSVEPLTPVPGSPAVQNGTPTITKRSVPEVSASANGEDASTGAQGTAKEPTPVPKVE